MCLLLVQFSAKLVYASDLLLDYHITGYPTSEKDLETLHPSSNASFSAIGQTFTVGFAAVITKASFVMKRVGSPSGSATIQLYAYDSVNNIPTGSALATSSSIAISTISTSDEWITLNFDGTCQLNTGTTYFICFGFVGSGTLNPSNRLEVGYKSNVDDGSGTQYYSSAWHSTSRDWFFYVYGQLPPATYSNQYLSNDGNVLMYGGLILKPNTIHSYIPQFNGRFHNITLYSGTLGLSKSDYAYNIACSTNDNITILINQWFYNDLTQFKPTAAVESTLSFTVNGRNKGEPQGVSGVSSWSYDEESTTVSLTAANNALVTIRWLDVGTTQLVWYMDRIPTWLGMGGMLMVTLAPVMFVFFGKKDEWQSACVWGLMLFVIGMGLIIGWLW